jgi:hypothetical protein
MTSVALVSALPLNTFDLTNAVPHGERALSLRQQNRAALVEGITHLQEASLELFQEGPGEAFDQILRQLKNPRTPLFPFILLNQHLITAAQKDDLATFKSLVDTFVYHPNPIGNAPCAPLSYGNSLLTPHQWSLIHHVMTPERLVGATMEPPSAMAFQKTAAILTESLAEIRRLSQNDYDEITHLVDHILVVTSDKYIAGSSFDLMGLVCFKDGLDFPITVEYLLHETAHQYLFNLMVFDAVCTGEGIYESPLRKDPRPMEGIYHATFVLARILAFYHKALAKGTSIPTEIIQEKMPFYQQRFEHGYQLIPAYPVVT